MPRLVIQPPGQPPKLFELLKPRVTLGRSEKNDLVLDDLNTSRFHAVLEQTPEGYKIADQNSLNGIYVDDRRVRQALLEDGTKVRLGDTVLRFEHTSAAWEKTDIVVANPTAAHLVAEADQRELREATLAFRRLAAEAPAKQNVAELQKALRDAERRALFFEVVCHTRRSLQDATTLQEVLSTVTDLVFSATRAERVLLMLWDEEKKCLSPADIHMAPGGRVQDAEVALSQTLLNRVLESHKAVLVRDAKADPALLMRDSVSLSGLRSAICVPIQVQSRFYGLIYADNRRLPMVFDEDDLEVLSILAMEAALALDSARARQDVLQQERIRMAYRRFLPEHVVERLVSTPDSVKLGGARQPVTALFADLRGFTSMAETLPPEEVVELLNAFFTEMTHIIFRHNGTLDKYLGDGLLAVFGAPLAEATDALRAVQCAISMQATLAEISEEWRRQGRPLIPMGIGVNSGEAIVGNIGSPEHMEYTVIGDTVNVAARLTSVAGPGEILLGDSTYQQVQSHIAAESLPPLQLKGKREPAKVYRVLRKAFDTGPFPVQTRSSGE